MSQYTIFEILPDGNLKISLNPDLTIDEIWEAWESEWWGLNEAEFCNGYFDVDDYQRHRIGALTASPIISDTVIDEETTSSEINKANVWWYPEYQFMDEHKELFLNGHIIFDKA